MPVKDTRNLFIVGDVHGCYYTFKKLIKEHWDKDNEILIQVGDLINKGPHSGKSLLFARKLSKEYPKFTYFIKGNHEHYLLTNHDKFPANKLYKELKKEDITYEKALKWIRKMPLSWQNDDVLVTHAGIALNTNTPYQESNIRGVLFNRSPLKNVGKVQVIGHSVVKDGKPIYYHKSNSWNIDTGAYLGICLTGIKLSYTGELLKIISLPTSKKDKL